MENKQKNHNAPEIMHLQGIKGLLVGFDQPDPEMECVGCQRLRIQMGALHSTLTFELETLSAHMHLIERLQDEYQRMKDEHRHPIGLLQPLPIPR